MIEKKIGFLEIYLVLTTLAFIYFISSSSEIVKDISQPICEIALTTTSTGYKLEAVKYCHVDYTDRAHIIIRQMRKEEIEAARFTSR